MATAAVWPWIALAGLGAFHGVNPAMGWLFAVALGLQQRRRAAVLGALPPIALGHAVSIATVALAVAALRAFFDLRLLQVAAALVLFGFGIYRLAARHRGRGGMRVGFGQLALWSFLMATAHGAGVMLLPVLLRLPMAHDPAMHSHMAALAALGQSASVALAAVGVHTLAMLVVVGAVAIVVYEWVGLAFLRRGWVNLDLVWALALIAAGVWAVRVNRRWLVNIVAVFGAIHFYTQWFEKLGASPLSVLLGGVIMLVIALVLWSFNKRMAAV